MATMQNIVDRGRSPLNDDGKVRFTDPALLVFANDFLKLAKRVRPDLFFGSYGTPFTDLAVGDNFPLPPEYEAPAADYVTGRAETTGGEAELEERATAFLTLSVKGLTG